jgi:hypothetical protein
VDRREAEAIRTKDCRSPWQSSLTEKEYPMWGKRNEERPIADNPLAAFKKAIAKATDEAEARGVLAVQIHRYLDDISREYSHKAMIRNMQMGGR